MQNLGPERFLYSQLRSKKPMLRSPSQEHDRTKSRGLLGAMRRKLVWIDEPRFKGWGCSECAWVFNPSGSPIGESLAEMMQNYERERDKDFAAHVCAERFTAK